LKGASVFFPVQRNVRGLPWQLQGWMTAVFLSEIRQILARGTAIADFLGRIWRYRLRRDE